MFTKKRINNEKWKKTVKFILKAMIVIVFSFLFYIVLDASSRHFSFRETFSFLKNHKKNLLVSMVMISSLITLILAVINNLKIGTGFLSYTLILLSVANYLKIQFREEPIVPTDLLMVTSLSELLQMIESVFLLAFIVLTITLFYFLYKSSKKRNIKMFSNNKKGYVMRLVFILTSLLLMNSVHNIHAEDNKFRQLKKKVGFVTYKGSTLMSYRTNGFIYAFVDNFSGQAMQQPKNYSKDNVYEVLKKYQPGADQRNIARENESFDDISVVFILSESLADPSVISGTNVKESPIPYIQSNHDKYAAGKLIVPIYGGGTPNSEFEVLTGLSIQNLESNMNIPYQRFLTRYNFFPSFVSRYKNDTNDKAIAVHSYNSKMYKRRDVFKVLDFDEMYFEKDMNNTEVLGKSNFISDKSSYEEVLDHLKTRRDENLFIHLITMQNHAAYWDKYDEYNFEPISYGSDATDEQLKYFMQGIYETDKATKAFISELQDIDRKVAVVFYGDHHPGIYSEFVKDNDPFDLVTTDYFVYTNFNSSQTDTNETVSTTNLMNVLYDASNVKVDAYLQLIKELRSEIVAGKDDYYLLNTGEHKTYLELSDKQRKLLSDYYLIQYDIIEGDMFTTQYLDGTR